MNAFNVCARSALLLLALCLALPETAMALTREMTATSETVAVSEKPGQTDGGAHEPSVGTATASGLSSPAPVGAGAALGKVALFLVLVLGLILALAWLAQRLRLANGGLVQRQGPASAIRTLVTHPLGVKEKIAIVEVGSRQLVLGITPHQINTLAELDEPLDLGQAAPVSFADLLKKAVRS